MSHIVIIHQSYGTVRVQPPSWCSDAAVQQHRSPYGAIAYRALIGPRAEGVPSYHGYSVDSINLCDKQSSHCEGGLVLAAYSFALISYYVATKLQSNLYGVPLQRGGKS